MSTGIGINSEVVAAFDEMKLRRSAKYIIFRIGASLEIEIESQLMSADYGGASSEELYQKFYDALPKDEGRYGVIDLEYHTATEGSRNRLVLVAWNPDEGKTRSKMMYAASKTTLVNALHGVHKSVQATDLQELAFESVFAEIAPKDAIPGGRHNKEE